MKYKNGNWYQISKSGRAKAKKTGPLGTLLYDTLVELEHNFTGKRENFFYRTLTELAADSSLSKSTVERLIPKLVEVKAIEAWQGHFINPETGKKSEKHMTFFRILD